MADRIINANILKNNPNIIFSSRNIINGVEWEETTWQSERNNICEPLHITFYQATSDKDTTLKYVGDNIEINKIPFAFKQGTSSGHASAVAMVVFNIDKNKIIQTTTAEKPIFTILSKKDIIQTDGEKQERLEIIEKITPTTISSLNNISFEYETPILYEQTNIGTNITKKYKVLTNDISIVGKCYTNTKKKVFLGEEKGFILKSNELMQIGGDSFVDIGKKIATKIINEYKNGKVTITCSVNISDGTPLFVVGEIAKVYGFDGKSVSRNRDGTDKRFKITSAEFRWAGQSTQNLEMVEVIE